MGSEPNNDTTNTVHDASGSNIVQAGSVGNLMVGGRDRRTVWLLALVLVVVMVAAAVIVWLVRRPDTPKPPGDPLAVDTSVGQTCGDGWVAPEPGRPSLP